MADLEKEIKKEEKKIAKFFSKKENLWKIISLVLVVALILVVAWPQGISKATAGKKLVDYLNTNVVQDGGITLKDVVSQGNLYQVNVIYQSQTVPVYMTKDGKYYISPGAVTEMKTTATNPDTQPSTTVPKSDKPKVDLYIFSYCPYGTQTEKGIIPVYNLLKNKADINIVAIGAMHGEFEKTESLRQLCVEKLYGTDMLMNYLAKFDTNSSVGNCQGTDSCVSPIINSIFSSLKIDAAKVNSCMKTDAPALYAAQEAQAQSLGIGGSPTLVINDVQTQSGRSPAALLATVCSAFNTAPSECSQVLDSATPAAGFGGSTGTASGASCG